ncbi:MAG: VCBS repeat-containing protein [Bacteroidales bacterium]|nr:VCBS repeat-containing protein [Bacteroidales bacterium]
MRCHNLWSIGVLALFASGTVRSAEPGFPQFDMQEIESSLKVGYAVLLEDINGDQKKDIVIVDTNRVVWYENPTWKRRTILGPKTKPDNVCITALDITGDGLPELVLGAAWKPFDTQTPGTLHWLERGATLDDEWTMHPLPCDEPTVHRVRAIDLDGDGKPEIVHMPLMGREATKAGNWMNGRPVRVMALAVPADPRKPEHWKPQVVIDNLHVMHNFAPAPRSARGTELLAAAYEGVFSIRRTPTGWNAVKIGTGNQDTPQSNRGASEIEPGRLAGNKPVIATIEPWHGHQVVVYTPPTGSETLWNRHLLDEQLRWGHGVEYADLDGDGGDELIVGVRDDPNPARGDKHTERRGVRLYRATDGTGQKWERQILENGGVAVEDLAVADLNGDGKPDIVAVGRATGNARIYWNRGK